MGWRVSAILVVLLVAATAAADRLEGRDAEEPDPVVASSSDAATQPGPARLAPPAADLDCAALRQRLHEMRKEVRTHRGSVLANQRWADDSDRSDASRRSYELRAQEEAHRLARSQRKLAHFLEEQRRERAPSRCLQ